MRTLSSLPIQLPDLGKVTDRRDDPCFGPYLDVLLVTLRLSAIVAQLRGIATALSNVALNFRDSKWVSKALAALPIHFEQVRLGCEAFSNTLSNVQLILANHDISAGHWASLLGFTFDFPLSPELEITTQEFRELQVLYPQHDLSFDVNSQNLPQMSFSELLYTLLEQRFCPEFQVIEDISALLREVRWPNRLKSRRKFLGSNDTTGQRVLRRSAPALKTSFHQELSAYLAGILRGTEFEGVSDKAIRALYTLSKQHADQLGLDCRPFESQGVLKKPTTQLNLAKFVVLSSFEGLLDTSSLLQQTTLHIERFYSGCTPDHRDVDEERLEELSQIVGNLVEAL